MSRLGRYVGRARGQALRVAGVPRTPNLPSGRALAQNAVRDVTSGRVTGRRRSTGSTGSDAGPAGPADDGACRRRDDVGLRVRWPGFVALALAIVFWFAASCGQHATYVPPPPTSCADRVIWHGARLSDC